MLTVFCASPSARTRRRSHPAATTGPSASGNKRRRLRSGKQRKELKGHTDYVRAVVFVDGGGQLLLSGSYDRTIIEWDVEKGEQLFVFRGHTRYAWSLCILRGTNIFVSCSWDKTVRFWDRARREQVGRIDASNHCYAVAVRADNKHVAVGGEDEEDEGGYLAVWNLTACLSSSGDFDFSSHRLLKVIPVDTSAVYSVEYNRDGSLLATGADNSIKIYNSSTDEYPLLRTLTGHGDVVRSVAFADCHFIFSGSWDKTIKLWDATDGRCIRTITTHTNAVWSVAVSADGTLLISGSEDKTVAIIARGDEVDVEELFGDMKNAAGNLSSSSSSSNNNSNSSGNKRRRLE